MFKLQIPKSAKGMTVQIGNEIAELTGTAITVKSREFADHLIKNFGLTEKTADAKEEPQGDKE